MLQKLLREAGLAAVLLAGAAVVVWGVSDWSLPAAKIVAGILGVTIGLLFLLEGGD